MAPDTPYKDVVERLVESGISGLPVIEGDRRLVGIVTEADLVSKAAYGGKRRRALAVLADVVSARPHHWATKGLGSVAADVMTTDVVTCAPDDDMRVVAWRMLGAASNACPSCKDGAVVGIVSRQDLLRMFARNDHAIAADVTHVLTTDANRLDDAHVLSSVRNGIVTLTGDVRYAWDVPIVAAMAKNVAGVIDVVNDVHNREPNPEPMLPWMYGARS